MGSCLSYPSRMSAFTEELMVAFAREDFSLTETLYRILIPMEDNMHAEATCEMSYEGNGWEMIRNRALRRVMEYDSTVKLWNATRKGHPLYQQLPHTIYYGNNSEHYFRLRRLNVPTELKMARLEFKNLMKTGKKQIIKPYAENILADWDFNLEIRRRIFKTLMVSSHVLPRAAVNSKILSLLVKHSLQTELLKDIEVNAYSMGLISNSEDFRFGEVVRKFQEPSEMYIPLSFTTTYKSSLYAIRSDRIEPARMWDSEPLPGVVKKDAAVEFNFIVQNLITAWPRRFDRLHNFSHEIAIRDVLPENMDLSKVSVKRSESIWAKIIRGENEFPNERDEMMEWMGTKGFRERTIDIRGLRLRKNANNE